MTRKRLTDMLRAEIQKSPESESEELITVSVDAVSIETESVGTESVGTKSATSNSQLEDAISELKSSLEKSQKKETTLEKQVAKLQADLQEQGKYVEQLKEYLDQANQIKSELDRVKQENELLTAQIEQSRRPHQLAPKAKATATEPAKSAYIQRTALTGSGRGSRPVGSNSSSSKMNNENIGWFD